MTHSNDLTRRTAIKSFATLAAGAAVSRFALAQPTKTEVKTEPTPAKTALPFTISLAQENLLRQQHADGHWCGELLVDSTLCSDFVLFMHWFGEVDHDLQQRCVRHILKRQLSDGG